MNAVIRALFDDAAITGAQTAGLKDTSTAAMQAAVREWFELFFLRETVKDKNEDPAQRIPYTIINKLTKACFAEYDSSFNTQDVYKRQERKLPVSQCCEIGRRWIRPCAI